MKTTSFAVLVGLVSAAASLGCNGGGNGTCGKVQPCGGSVVGTWKIVSECSTAAGMDIMNSTCPGETVQANNTSASGNFVFNADMTYTETATISGSATVGIPASCLTMSGITLTCAQLDQVFQLEAMDPTSGLQSGRCASAGATCNCTIVLAPQTTTDMGTYTTAGTTLTLTSTSATGTGGGSGDYCVQMNELHLISTMAAAMGSMGPAVITGDIVADKQ